VVCGSCLVSPSLSLHSELFLFTNLPHNVKDINLLITSSPNWNRIN
jgi:hypothetical protein